MKLINLILFYRQSSYKSNISVAMQSKIQTLQSALSNAKMKMVDIEKKNNQITQKEIEEKVKHKIILYNMSTYDLRYQLKL